MAKWMPFNSRPGTGRSLGLVEPPQSTTASNLARSQDLFGQGFIGQAALDEARKTAELADAEVRAAQKQLDTTAAGADTTLTIAGIFDLGNKGANERSTFVALRTGQSLLALPGGVTSLDVTVRDVYAAEVVAQRITAATGVQADSWIKTNAELFTAIAAQSTSNNAIRFFVGLSVAFGIASVPVSYTHLDVYKRQLTRSRATPEHTPNALMATYYGQRATAGLIITEGTSPSPNGLGYPRIPGLLSLIHI